MCPQNSFVGVVGIRRHPIIRAHHPCHQTPAVVFHGRGVAQVINSAQRIAVGRVAVDCGRVVTRVVDRGNETKYVIGIARRRAVEFFSLGQRIAQIIKGTGHHRADRPGGLSGVRVRIARVFCDAADFVYRHRRPPVGV